MNHASPLVEWLNESISDQQLVVPAETELHHVVICAAQEESDLARSLQINIEENARYFLHHFCVSEGKFKDNITINFSGKNAQAKLNGLNLGLKEAEQAVILSVNHAKDNCTSEQNFRGIFSQKSRGSFSGKIIVKENTHRTVAHQSSKNLLLSDTAIAMSRPELEIDSDDVECTHGATMGQLDESELFYLQSRGISEAKARSMLIQAFAKELIEACPNTEVRKLLLDKMGAL